MKLNVPSCFFFLCSVSTRKIEQCNVRYCSRQTYVRLTSPERFPSWNTTVVCGRERERERERERCNFVFTFSTGTGLQYVLIINDILYKLYALLMTCPFLMEAKCISCFFCNILIKRLSFEVCNLPGQCSKHAPFSKLIKLLS